MGRGRGLGLRRGRRGAVPRMCEAGTAVTEESGHAELQRRPSVINERFVPKPNRTRLTRFTRVIQYRALQRARRGPALRRVNVVHIRRAPPPGREIVVMLIYYAHCPVNLLLGDLDGPQGSIGFLSEIECVIGTRLSVWTLAAGAGGFL